MAAKSRILGTVLIVAIVLLVAVGGFTAVVQASPFGGAASASPNASALKSPASSLLPPSAIKNPSLSSQNLPAISSASGIPLSSPLTQLPKSTVQSAVHGGSASSVPGAASALQYLQGGASLPAAGPRPSDNGWGSPYYQNCFGVWPSSGQQSLYENGCYGHDEPNLNFYSPIAGSGGNVTWNVTLPVDRSATQNQSSLYSAIWFGMTLTAPPAWMNQCFLELQFYPDQSWYNPNASRPGLTNYTVNGNWIGAVVAWQIDINNSENPCFYQPLWLHGVPGPTFLNMTQGDRVTVTMNSWVGDATGTVLNITDDTNGQWSTSTMVNYTGPNPLSFTNPFNWPKWSTRHLNYPLDTAYVTNSWQNGLQWTPGGESPISFAFETGHDWNPSTNSGPYGNCGPGNAGLPFQPCPSYDPGSWANDTLRPWQFWTPTFYDATSHWGAAQVGFGQDFGGIALIPQLDFGTCAGKIGSAFCDYPWWSFMCSTNAFTFGATDYSGVTTDFGQWTQYNQGIVGNGVGFGYYPPTNFSIPACANPSYSVTVGTSSGTGWVDFLSTPYTAPTAVAAVGPGDYSLNAIGTGGMIFKGWVTTGLVSVLTPSSPWTSLVVSGAGSAEATFAASAPPVAVTFVDVPAGTILVQPGGFVNPGAPIATVPSGGIVSLVPGVYGILGNPTHSPSSVFKGWSSSGPGAVIASPTYPYSWLIVTGTSASVTVTATYSLSVLPGHVEIVVINGVTGALGGGVVTFGGVSSTSTILAIATGVGAYTLVAAPNASYVFGGWAYGNNLVMSDFLASTNVTLEQANFYCLLEAFFIPTVRSATLTIVASPATAGQVLIQGPGYPFATLVPSGTLVPVYPTGFYIVGGVANSGENFSAFSVNNTARGWLQAPSTWTAYLTVNASVTLTATFLAAPLVSVTFSVSPAGSGSILFNALNTYATTTTNSSVGKGGSYWIVAIPAAGYNFVSYTNSSNISLVFGPGIQVKGNGSITANFAAVPVVTIPVTLVANAPAGATLSLNGQSVSSGGTVQLPATGTYTLSITVTGSGTFTGWWPSPGLSVASSSSASTMTTVSRPGTITAVVASFGGTVTATPNPTDVGVATTLTVTPVAAAGTVFTYTWTGLPAGCTSSNVSSLPCTTTTAGTYSVGVSMKSQFGETATATPVSLVVNGLPVVSSFTVTPNIADLGISVTFTTVVTGGTSPFTYAYTGLPAGCGSTSGTFMCAPTVAGTFTVNVTATDSLGKSAGGHAVVVTLNPIPTVAVSLSSSSVTVNNAVTITAAVTGGTSPYTYAYTNLPAGCATANASSLSCTPTATGTFTVTVTVTDASGKMASSTATLTVNSSTSSGGLFGLNSTDTAILIAVIVLVIAGIIAAVLLSRRRKKPTIVATPAAAAGTETPGTPSTAPMESSPSNPPPNWKE